MMNWLMRHPRLNCYCWITWSCAFFAYSLWTFSHAFTRPSPYCYIIAVVQLLFLFLFALTCGVHQLLLERRLESDRQWAEIERQLRNGLKSELTQDAEFEQSMVDWGEIEAHLDDDAKAYLRYLVARNRTGDEG